MEAADSKSKTHPFPLGGNGTRVSQISLKRCLLMFGAGSLRLCLRVGRRGPWAWPIRGEEAFTLNEILLSIAFIMIGILGFSLTAVKVIQGNYVSGNFAAATNLAQDKMEEIMAQGAFADVNNCAAPPDRDVTALGEPGGIYDRCWSISDSSLGTGLKELRVTVRWTDYRSHEVTLASLGFMG